MSRDLLAEHCDAPGCVNGYVKWPDSFLHKCVVCHGTTRRIRGTHDARSAIDYEPADGPAIRHATWQRIVTLARAARDASNSDVVRALLDELEAVGR
jgi:hypothetical protein